MARPKKQAAPMTAINFRCPTEIKDGLETLAFARRQSVTDLLLELLSQLVADNKQLIDKIDAAAQSADVNFPFNGSKTSR
jgi:predicted transcriptional regulator